MMEMLLRPSFSLSLVVAERPFFGLREHAQFYHLAAAAAETDLGEAVEAVQRAFSPAAAPPKPTPRRTVVVCRKLLIRDDCWITHTKMPPAIATRPPKQARIIGAGAPATASWSFSTTTLQPSVIILNCRNIIDTAG